MQIPKYWAKSDSVVENDEGDIRHLNIWRWSETSISEAQQSAADALQQAMLRFKNNQELNQYSYGRNPLREEIIQSIKNADGNQVGIVTRNRYGALVLNAAQAMFIDIDFPEAESNLLEVLGLGGIGKLFGKKAPPPPSPEQTCLQTIEQWSQAHRDVSMRVYRTYGGLRCLITNEILDPTQESSLALMRELNSDTLYITLCRQQESFRARLTPKPWRCGVDLPPSRYPWDDIAQEQRYREWERTYERAASQYITCRLVKLFGKDETHPDIAPIVSLHDQIAYPMDKPNLA
jgi:hypothetical protein